MLQEKLFEEKILVKNLRFVTINTDVFSVLVNKSEENDFKVSIEYTFVCEKKQATNDEKIPGYCTIDEKKRAIAYELLLDDLIKIHNTDTFLKANMYVEIPENIKIEIKSINSNISVENVSAEFHVKNIHGNVAFENAGSGTIESTHGAVLLKNITNNFSINTTDGEVLIEGGIGGVLNVVSENGDIKLLDIDFNKIACKATEGNIRVELGQGVSDFLELYTINGNIYFGMDNFGCQNIFLKAENGNVFIKLPKGKMTNLDLSSDFGEIKCNIDTENAYEEIIDASKFFLNFGDDLSNIIANSKNGNILVKDFEGTLQGEMARKKKEFSYATENEVPDAIEDFINEMPLEDEIEIIDAEIDKASLKYKTRKIISQVKEHVSKENVDKVYTKTVGGFTSIKNKISEAMSKISVKTTSEEEIHKKTDDKKNEAALKILDMVEKKVISVEEAEKLLKSLRR